MNLRTCTKCGISKTSDEYYSNSRRTSQCKECLRAYQRSWNKANPDSPSNRWLKDHPEKRREVDKAARIKLRLEVLTAYGAKCQCCGEDRTSFLAIDHINGGGNEQRRRDNLNSSVDFFRWLRKNNWPDGFRCLCHNCNLAIGFYGRCPHQDDGVSGLP